LKNWQGDKVMLQENKSLAELSVAVEDIAKKNTICPFKRNPVWYVQWLWSQVLESTVV